MADGDRHPTLHQRRVNDSALALAREWKRLGRAATFVAVLTSPVLFVLLYRGLEWGFLGSLLGTIAGVAIFRGLIDVLAHRFIPAPTLYGAESELKDEDVIRGGASSTGARSSATSGGCSSSSRCSSRPR